MSTSASTIATGICTHCTRVAYRQWPVQDGRSWWVCSAHYPLRRKARVPEPVKEREQRESSAEVV